MTKHLQQIATGALVVSEWRMVQSDTYGPTPDPMPHTLSSLLYEKTRMIETFEFCDLAGLRGTPTADPQKKDNLLAWNPKNYNFILCRAFARFGKGPKAPESIQPTSFHRDVAENKLLLWVHMGSLNLFGISRQPIATVIIVCTPWVQWSNSWYPLVPIYTTSMPHPSRFPRLSKLWFLSVTFDHPVFSQAISPPGPPMKRPKPRNKRQELEKCPQKAGTHQ